MSEKLTHEEHLELLACIAELHACRSLTAFPEHALRTLATLVPSNLSAFNEVNVPRKRIVYVMDHPPAGHDRIRVEWERHSGQHPLVRYIAETGDGQAIKISDFLSEQAFHRLDIYRACYRALGAEDQMSISIRSDNGVLLAFAFNRAHRDFTESDRVKLNLVRPHLLQAYANVEELSGHVEEKNDLQTALRETGQGVIALESDTQVAHATPGIDECLARYFPVPTPMRSLPLPLVEWLDSDPTQALVARAADAKLIVRRPRHTERRLLFLSEERVGGLPGDQRLTAREAEVLHWLAAGKSNPEIGAILGIALGTVKQHVEHILAKLGVENRTAATAVARERGLVR